MSDQWYTPKYIFDALGNPRFDMDVAAPKLIPAYINAREWYWEGALEKEWAGFVWMNPPYGGRNSLTPWLKKFVEHGNGLCLVPDRTSAPWFQKFAYHMDAILFTPKIKFLRPNGEEGKSPSNGSAIMAIGQIALKHLIYASNLGLIVSPHEYDL